MNISGTIEYTRFGTIWAILRLGLEVIEQRRFNTPQEGIEWLESEGVESAICERYVEGV